MSDLSGSFVAELQQKLAAHEARIAALERRPMPVVRAAPPAPYVEPGTTISYPQPSVLMPSAEEFSSLAKVILSLHPELGLPAGDSEAKWRWDREFQNAVRAVSAFGRTD